MANKTIGELTEAAALGGTELVHIVQGGNSRRVTVSKLANGAGFGTIASAATMDIGAEAEGTLEVTLDEATVTSLGTADEGIRRTLILPAGVTLTHNATSLMLLGGADIPTAAGDVAVMVSKGSGNWRCMDYERAAGPVDRRKQSLSVAAVTLSGGAVDFLNIPQGARRITISLYGVSVTDNSSIKIRVGPSGGPTAVGYETSRSQVAASTVSSVSETTAFSLSADGNTRELNGKFELVRHSGNNWVGSGMAGVNAQVTSVAAGRVALSGELAVLRVASDSGSFDAGEAALLVEFD